MTPELAIDLFKQTLVMCLWVVAPFLGVALVVGLITSILQAVTSLQEPTLVFAPKILVMAAVLIFTAPWLLRTLTEFTLSFFTRMSTLTG